MFKVSFTESNINEIFSGEILILKNISDANLFGC